MAFTQSDITNIENAIVDMATGDRASMVTLESGKIIRYAETSIESLQSLLSTIKQSLGTVPTRAYARQGGRAKI